MPLAITRPKFSKTSPNGDQPLTYETKEAPACEVQAVDLTLLESTLCYRLRMAQLALSTSFINRFEKIGLTPGKFAVFATIAANPGISQSRLGDALSIRKPNMVKVINNLESSGLVGRQPSPFDRRTVELRVTQKGTEIYRELLHAVPAHDLDFAHALDACERVTLIRLLEKLA